MKLIVTESREAAGERIAAMLARSIADNPRLVLGLSCGMTSMLAYRELVGLYYERGGFSFRQVATFSTDEYMGLDPADRRSTRAMMNYHLYRQVDIPREHTYVPRGDATDLDLECRAYDLLIQARGGLGLVVLGLGLNEPGSSARSRTRIVDLTPSTLAAISGGERFRNLEETPAQAISMGMATILDARQVLIVATGLGKAEALDRMVTGRVGPGLPASLLTGHAHLTVVADRDACSKLTPDIIASLT